MSVYRANGPLTATANVWFVPRKRPINRQVDCTPDPVTLPSTRPWRVRRHQAKTRPPGAARELSVSSCQHYSLKRLETDPISSGLTSAQSRYAAS